MRFVIVALFLPLLAAAEPGPTPREVRLDPDGDILPPGALARLGSTRFREVSAVRITFSPDGSRAICSDDGNVRVWDLKTGKLLQVWPLPEDFEGVVSEDGRLAVRVKDRGADVWDVPGNKLVRTLGNGRARFTAAAVSPDGKSVATAARWARPSPVRVWDLASGADRAVGAFDSDIQTLFFLDGGRTLMVVLSDDWAVAFDAATGLERYRKQLHPRALLTPAGNWFLALRPTGIELFEAATGKPVPEFKYPPVTNDLHRLALSSDGTRLALGDHSKTVVWDLVAGKELARWPRKVQSVAFSPDGRTVAVVADGLRHFDLATGPELAGPNLPAAGRGISSFGWSADGRTVLVSRPDDGYDLFDAATGQHVRGLPGKADVRPWFGPGSWQTSRLCPMLVSPPELYAPPINPGGHRAGDSQVHTWDRRLLAARGAHDEPLGRGVDARTAESPPSAPTVVSVYEAWTGRWLYRLEPPIHGDMAFSQDGRRLLTIDRNGFRVWDSVTGKELLHRPLPARGRLPTGTGAGAGIAWAPDGRRVAIGDRDGTILIWDVAVPRPKRMPLSPANLDQLWTDLGSDDPHVGWKAVNALADRPGESVEFLLDRVTPVKPLDAKTVQPLIADLDSPSYRTRERATRAALEAGDAIRPAIDAALKAGPGPESRKRLEDLQARLANGHPPTTNDLRRLRAIAVLEAAGSEEARGRIEELALGMPGARVTMEAKLTAERLATRDQSGR